MVKTEILTINGYRFTKTYSDEGFKICKVGTTEIYDEAIDMNGTSFVYEETDEKIDSEVIDEYSLNEKRQECL